MSDIMLGTIFRNYRMNRHISIHQAATKLTPATISRFERGAVDINTQSALQLMYNITMDPFEFEDQAQIKFPSPWANLVQQDRMQIQIELENYLKQAEATPLTAILREVMPLLAKDYHEHYTLSPNLEQRLADLLAYPLLWGDFEATLLIASLPFASIEFGGVLWSRIARQVFATPDWEQFTTAMSALLVMLSQDESGRALVCQQTAEIYNQNQRHTRYRNTMPLLQLIKCGHDTSQRQTLSKAMTAIGLGDIVRFATAVLTTADASTKVWHNVALQDRHDPTLDVLPDAEILSGPTLASAC